METPILIGSAIAVAALVGLVWNEAGVQGLVILFGLVAAAILAWLHVWFVASLLGTLAACFAVSAVVNRRARREAIRRIMGER